MPDLLSTMDSDLPPSLTAFLVEYYTYTIATSILSVDARYSTQIANVPDVERRAREMVRSQYVGPLSGCWLELLPVIPKVFELGRTVMQGEDVFIPIMLDSDHTIHFAELHHRILEFSPNSKVSSNVQEAGYVYQSAILLYLLTI